MFYSRFLNSVMQIILSLGYGHPVTTYVPGHNLSHHKYTQTRKDFMRTTKLRFNSNLVNFLMFFFVILRDSLKNDLRYFAVQRKLKRPIYDQLKREMFWLYTIWVTKKLFKSSFSRSL